MRRQSLATIATCALAGVAMTGCEDSTERVEVEVPGPERIVEVEVPDERPVADIAALDGPIVVGESVTFDGSGSADDEAVTRYTWDFDLSDGFSANASGETATTTFDAPGGYTVTLEVADADGNFDQTSVFVEVVEATDDEAPVADAGPDRTVALYASIPFDGTGSSDNVGIESYTWDFDTADGIGEDATGANASHSYFVEGTFTVRLTVTDAAGNTSFDETDVTVGEDTEAPTVDIPDTYETAARAFIDFDASSATDDVGIASYAWDVDGVQGADGTDAILRYSYEAAGTYDGTLTVTDFAGNATTESFTVTVTDATPVSLFARPDLVELGAVAQQTSVEVALRFADGSTLPPDTLSIDGSGASFVSASSPEDGVVDITADAQGAGSLILQAAGLSVGVDVRVGGDVLVTTGLEHPNYPDERYFSVDTGTGSIFEIEDWAVGLTPVDAESFDGRGYILNSGAPSRENASLLVVDTTTLEEIASCDLGGLGAYAVAARAANEVYVAGVGAPFDDETATDDEPSDSALVKVDPTDCTVERVYVPGADEGVNGMGRGSDLDIFAETLIITDSGVDSSYSNETPSLRFFDMDAGVARQRVELPEGCLNAGWSTIHDGQIITGCTGDYGATPGAIVISELLTGEAQDVIAFETGAPAAWTFEPFSGYVFAGSGLSPRVGVIDVYGGRVLRELDGGIFLDVAPDDAFFADFEFILGIMALDAESVVAVSFTLDRFYDFDPLAAPGLQSVQSLARVTPDPGGRGAQLLMSQGYYRAPIVLETGNAQITAFGDGAEAVNVDGLYGAPAGGGNFSPNADATSLTTLPEGGYIQIDLTSVEVVDQPGPDFYVYENPFYAAGDYFSRAIDPARVQVSPDGSSWFDYPIVEDHSYPVGLFTGDARRYVSGFVGVEAVYANPASNEIPVGKPAAGGDAFDLAVVGLSSIKAIRVLDISGDGKSANLDAIALTNWRSQ